MCSAFKAFSLVWLCDFDRLTPWILFHVRCLTDLFILKPYRMAWDSRDYYFSWGFLEQTLVLDLHQLLGRRWPNSFSVEHPPQIA